MNEKLLRTGERIDSLQRKGYGIIQNPSFFCFGMDAVLLAHFADIGANETTLDLCSGNGIIPALLKAREKAKHISAIEIQDACVDMAERTMKLNGIEDSVKIICADIKEIDKFIKKGSFDSVTCNPPYMSKGEGLVSDTDKKAVARHEILCNIKDVAKAASYALRDGGRFFMVHRPRRMTEIFSALADYDLEIKRIRTVHSYSDSRANMLLIESVKRGGMQMIIEPPLIIYEKDGSYTPELKSLY